MGRLEQSLRKLAYAKSPDFDHVVQAYKDLYGIDLSRMKMKWSKHPVYNNGKRSYELTDDETGGSWVNDGTIRINPDMRSVMNRFNIDGRVNDFRRKLIAHELAHEVWHNQAHKKRIKKLIRDSLRQARKENFTTPYLDTYPADTPKKKFDSELFAEYMSDQLNKKAQAITPEEIEAMARPHYADSGSHGWNHIQDVLASARRMRRKELLKKELAALMYHDSSLLTGPRETHAEDSADIARKELAGKFSNRQLAEIANAIAHHRASYEGKRKSKLENLVAAADRDVFVDGNIDDYILRSYRYGLEHGMTPDEAVDNTFHHMPDKYGTRGYAYANVPKIYMDTYGDEVRKAQKAFDTITADRIREISKSASDAKYSLKGDPTYEDALKVFNKLDFDDRANIAPRHPDFLRNVPDDILFDRQVVIDDDGNPVGFNEFYYGRDKLGRRQPPHNSIAVVPEARGNGLSRLMVEAAIRKARKEKIRRLVWEAFADNEGSIRAALSAGFEDATPKNAKGYRRFVYRVSEKKASSKKETYESGEGEVESYTPDKTKDHDEIVLRTKDGRRIVISNNTRLGKALKPRKGDSVGYHGYGVKGTNVIHKVHPNGRQRGGWLEHVKAASAKGGEMTEKERRERRRRILRRAIIASIGAGALAAPAYYAYRLNRAGEAVSRIHDETNPHLSLGQLEKELNKQEHLPKVRVGSLSPLSLSRLLMRFKSGVPVYAQKHKGGYMNAAAVAKYNPNDPQKGFDRPFVLSLTTHPKILAHELGHVIDYKNGTFVRENFQRRKSRLKEAILTIVAPSKTTQMQNEIRAWDNAKVDASDPLRRAALGTYFAGQRMNLAKDLKGPVALSSAIALGYDMKRGKKKREEEEEDKDSKKEQKTK